MLHVTLGSGGFDNYLTDYYRTNLHIPVHPSFLFDDKQASCEKQMILNKLKICLYKLQVVQVKKALTDMIKI